MKNQDCYQIRVEGIFESAHYLYNYYPDGSDEDLHGHSWKVEVFCRTNELNNGISIDYYTLNAELDKIVNKLDHKCLNNLEYFKDVNTTSENIAKYIYDQIKQNIPENINIHEIRVWEGPKQYASYIPCRPA